MELNKDSNITDMNLGGSIFWIILVVFSILGLSYLGIWSYQEQSIPGVALSVIFFGMIATGILLSKGEVFDLSDFKTNSLSFNIGLLAWLGITNSNLSVLSVTENRLFSQIAGELPEFQEFLMNAIIIPISEELLWMIALPFVTFSILNTMGKSLPVFKNTFLQLTIITILTGLTFSFFHVGKTFLVFLAVAFVFRMVLIFASYGDIEWNWLPGLALVPSFAVGSHIGNNWGVSGFWEGLNILTQNYVGWLVILFLIITIFASLDKIGEMIMGEE